GERAPAAGVGRRRDGRLLRRRGCLRALDRGGARSHRRRRDRHDLAGAQIGRKGSSRRRRSSPRRTTTSPPRMPSGAGSRRSSKSPATPRSARPRRSSDREKGLQPPASVVAATDDYFAAEDAFGRWIEEELEVTGDAAIGTTSQEL